MRNLQLAVILMVYGAFLISIGNAQGNCLIKISNDRKLLKLFYVERVTKDTFESTIFLELDCNDCISAFDQNGGCNCFHDKNCDHKTLVPEGCFHCGKQGGKYCINKLGNCQKLSG